MPVRNFEPVKRAPRRRFVLPRHWQHVSARTLHGRFAFENFHPEFKARVWGFIGRANVRYGVNLGAFVLMSNHFHALLQCKKSSRVSQWCQYVKANLARLSNEFHGTRGPVWHGPFRHSNLLHEDAELESFRYICAHGTKEGLVSHPRNWPGPNCISALLDGTAIEGLWFDYEAWRAAQRVRHRPPRSAFFHKIPVVLTPLSIGHRSPTRWREICREVIRSVLQNHGKPGLPEVHIPKHDHTHIPLETKKSRVECFDARGGDPEEGRRLLREAREARRSGVEASVYAHRRMAERGLEDPNPPEGMQWTALIVDALRGEIAEAEFPGRPTAPPPTLMQASG